MREDLTGRKFGRLLVMEARKHNIHGGQVWWCRCECGVEIPALGPNLIDGNTKSCGCLKRDLDAALKAKQLRLDYIVRPASSTAEVKLQSHCKTSHSGALDPNCNACSELRRKTEATEE